MSSKRLNNARQLLHHHENYLVRRMSLTPGEALAIEFGDGGKIERIEVTAGEVRLERAE
jgi:hypothetical protein